MVVANRGGMRNSPAKARKSALRPIGCGPLSRPGPCSSRRRRLPSAQRSRCRHRAPIRSTASSSTATSGANATWCPAAASRVDSSRSSVSADGRHPPTASSASRRTNMPFPRSSAVPSAAQRPHWLSRSISCSSACARVSHEAGSLRGCRATWIATASGSRTVHARITRSRKDRSSRLSASSTPITSPRTYGIAKARTDAFVRGPSWRSRRTTRAWVASPMAARAASAVASVETSSTTSTSNAGVPSPRAYAWATSVDVADPMTAASLRAGTTSDTNGRPVARPVGSAAPDRPHASASRMTRAPRHARYPTYSIESRIDS